MECTKKEYFEIDVDGLSTTLAEETWKDMTSNISLDDLYVNGKDGLVKDEWARVFFNTKEAYLHLIAYYKKKEDGATEKGGDDN